LPAARWIGFSEDDAKSTAEGAKIEARIIMSQEAWRPSAFVWQRVEDNAFHL
jgi:hypothetical protein